MRSNHTRELSTTTTRVIRVGLTEAHGMAHELCQSPPKGVDYSVVGPTGPSPGIIHSPIRGYLRRFESARHDLIEAVLSPVLTSNNWIYSLAILQEAAAFSVLGCPLPRSLRVAFLKRLFLKDNFKKLIFWSEAGRATFATYGHIYDERLLRKVTTVYPAIRAMPDKVIRFDDENVNILFGGDFFRKGGVNVVDAFERAQRRYPFIRLRLCCDEKTDFNTRNEGLRSEFLSKIRRNPAIVFGRLTRDAMLRDTWPRTDIYALPTYAEAFGFALLEAMAFGVPVISTTCFAIPELVEHGRCGYLIDTSGFDCDRLFRGYVVDDIPRKFREYMTESVYEHLCTLIESASLRQQLGAAGASVARTKFSMERRNSRMLEIYREALQWS